MKIELKTVDGKKAEVSQEELMNFLDDNIDGLFPEQFFRLKSIVDEHYKAMEESERLRGEEEDWKREQAIEHSREHLIQKWMEE